ncbi:MAG: class II glutamine amidotransferase [Burkholderiales bacterium]|nr:class II glutamine amidotransferase [Burkholderiales bacterium]
MSSRRPVAVRYSLDEFSRNGSKLRNNRDGWGIAFARDREPFLVKEPHPAIDSPWVKFIAEHPIRTTNVIAHVRHATQGENTMENTHPFRRVLGRRIHLFAHNGTLAGIEQMVDEAELGFRPVGETDSELVFCTLLSQLEVHYKDNSTPSLQARLDTFAAMCAEMKMLGPSNFLYYDGEVLFVHADRRLHEEEGILVGPKPPGLHIKRCWTCAQDEEVICPGLKVELRDHQVVLLASVPLDDYGWKAIPEGAVLALQDGEVLQLR